MRVTYLCLQPRLGTGASDTHVNGIVGALRHHGLDVDLVELQISSSSLGARLLAGLWLQLRHLRLLRRSHTVYVRMHPTAAVLPWLIGDTPLVVEVNGVPEDYVVAHPTLRALKPVIRTSIRRLLLHAHHVVVVTDGLGRRVQEWAPAARVTVLPNAADPEQFRPDLPLPSDLPTGAYALFFGALAAWQGIDLLVAAAQDSEWPSDLSLVVIGGGSVSGSVRSAATRHPDRIFMLGPRRPDRIPRYVANAELTFAVKRYHDPIAGQSPLKLYESVVACTPVVATPLHGCTDVQSLQSAIFEAEPTVPGIIAAMTRCRRAIADKDPDLLQAFAHARERETWDERGRVLVELLCDGLSPAQVTS